MAENFTFTEGVGATGAADDIAGVKYPKVKLVDGTADSTTDIEAGGGLEAGALRVTIATDSTLPAGTNAIGKLAANSGVDIGDVDVTSIAAGENHLGEIGLADNAITISATVDTGAYADGDVLFATQEIANAVRVNGDSCILQSVHVIDTDDQGVDFDLVFFNANTSLGTENSAPDIDDTEVLTTLGIYQFTNDYVDLGANQVRTDTGIGLLLKAGASTTSLYVAGITRGTPTYASGVITIVFGFLRN